MKVYVVRNNNRDYGRDDIRVYTSKDVAELVARQMIVEDLIDRREDLNEFAKKVVEFKRFEDLDVNEAMDEAVAQTLGGRCFVTEVEVRE